MSRSEQLLIITEHKAQMTVMGMSLALQLSSHKANYWKDYNLDLILALYGSLKDHKFYLQSHTSGHEKQLETQM